MGGMGSVLVPSQEEWPRVWARLGRPARREIERAARAGTTLERREDAALVAAYCREQVRREPFYVLAFAALILVLASMRMFVRDAAMLGVVPPLVIAMVRLAFWHVRIREAEAASVEFVEGGAPPSPPDLV